MVLVGFFSLETCADCFDWVFFGFEHIICLQSSFLILCFACCLLFCLWFVVAALSYNIEMATTYEVFVLDTPDVYLFVEFMVSCSVMSWNILE